MNIKPISGAVKQLLIEQLEQLEESYNANYKECKKAFNQAVFDRKPILIREFANECDYWQCEYAKINKIKRIIKDFPEVEEPAYRVTEETADVTVYEAEKGGDTPQPVAEMVTGAA